MSRVKKSKSFTVIAIAGSLREKSYNRMLLDAAAEIGGRACILQIVTLENIPLYNQDIEEKYGVPSAVKELQDRIAKADGLLLATPEYNHSISGVMKNAIDYLSRPPKEIDRVFSNLPVGIIGATLSRGGTALAQAAWLPILHTLGALPYSGSDVLVAKADTVFSKTGKLTDAKIKKQLNDYMSGFIEFMKEHRRV